MIPNEGPWGLLQSPNCKKRVPNSHPQVAVDSIDHFLADIYDCSETMHFQLHHLIYDVSPKFKTSENLQCLTTFFVKLLREIGQFEVVPCGDCAAACIVRAASIRAPGSDR
jgi:hypothetical protein